MSAKSFRSGSYGDRASLAGISIDTVHARIHEGVAYTVSALAASLSDAGDLDVLFRTPAAGAVHMRVSAAIAGDGELRIYESPTTSADGTELDVVNRNRLSSNVAGSAAFEGPTVSDPGTLIGGPTLLPGGTGGRAGAATASPIGEHILKFSTDYLLRLTNQAGQAHRAGLEALFYEARQVR